MGLFSPMRASAAQLRCASYSLSRSEHLQVLDRARRVMPTDAGPLSLESPCWNRDFAIAWVRTPDAVNLDGVRAWWSARCQRKRWRWSCDAATHERRIDVAITEDGRGTRIGAALPAGLSVERARAVVTRSAALASSPLMPLMACDAAGPDDVAMWQGARPNPPASLVCDPGAEVELTDSGTVVDYQSSLRFRFNEQDQAICWEALIFVD